MSTPYRQSDLRKLSALFDAVDNGTMTLPADITGLRAAHASVVDQLATLTAPTSPGNLSTLTDRIVRGAADSAPLPKVADIADAVAQRQATEMLANAARNAAQYLEEKLPGAIGSAADEIIEVHLAPVLATALGDLHRVAAVLAGQDLDPAILLVSPAKVREARVELDSIVARIAQVRRVQQVLEPHLDVALDVDGIFAEMSNRTDVWPISQAIGGRNLPPWPQTEPHRTLWLVEHGAQLWMPTGAQRDEAYRAALPDSPIVRGQHPLAAVGAQSY
jgi:hypothetical protein